MKILEKMNDYKLLNFDYDNFLNIPLTSSEKKQFCELLDLRDSNGRTLMWKTVKSRLDDYYLKVIDKTIRINGKPTRVSIIIDELEKR